MAKKNTVNFFLKYKSNLEKLKDLRLYMIIIALVIFSLAVTLQILTISKITRLNNEITALSSQSISVERKNQISTYEKLIEGVALLGTYQSEVTKIDDEIIKGELIDDIFFEKLDEAIPRDIIIERIKVKFDFIEIEGKGNDPDEIAHYQNNLENIDYVQQVHIQRINELEGQYTFSIECMLKEVSND